MTQGGKRAGAGRPVGSGKFKEATKPMRVPISQINRVTQLLKGDIAPQLPLYSNSVSAGFPSPADDDIESTIDLNDHLIKHPSATFLVRATGESMKNAGIFPGDILVVDRSLTAENGKVVIAVIDGELTVKRLQKNKEGIVLLPDNPEFTPIVINDAQSLTIWGVVTHVIHNV